MNGNFLRLVYFLISLFIIQPSWAQMFNDIFKENIKTSIIRLSSDHKELLHENQIISLENVGNATLEFDDINLKNTNYFLRIIHCNSNWKPSNLNEIEYLVDFNDAPIRYPLNSMGTKVPYLHYQIPLPKVRVSGNFIAMVYANSNKNDTVIIKRFSVYTNEVLVASRINFAKSNLVRNTHQSVELSLVYPENYTINSDENLTIEVRQNFRSENQLKKLPKPIVNFMERKITYHFYDQENIILGGNEFRMIDARSSQQKLSFVGEMRTTDQSTEIFTVPEVPQGNYSYVQRPDFNGSFVTSNYEMPENILMADYVWCHFYLKSRPFESEKIYLLGAFNGYKKNSTSELIYQKEVSGYVGKIQMKQGIYNYQFASDNPKNNILEGNHAQTENQYEILVYFKKPSERNDSLIGYQKISFPN